MWVLLPGVREKYASQRSQRDFDRALREDLTYFSGLQPRGARPVAEIISHALDSGFKIPWLDAALADEECRRFLPQSLFSVDNESQITSTTNKMTDAQREKARIRWEKDKITMALERVGRSHFDEWWEKPKASREFQATLAGKILEALQAEFPEKEEPRSLRAIEDRIRRWKREREAAPQPE